jgi:hypothetical protein
MFLYLQDFIRIFCFIYWFAMRNIRNPSSNQNKIPSTARNKYRHTYKAAADGLVLRYQPYSFYNRNTIFCRVPKNYASDRELGFSVTEINPLCSAVELEKTSRPRSVSFKIFIAHSQLKPGCLFRVMCHRILSHLNPVLTFKMQIEDAF